MKKLLSVLTLLVLALTFSMFVACEATPNKPDEEPKTKITISSTAITIEKDTEYTLTATGGDTYVWTSSDSEVATVDNGIVSALKVGQTTITVESKGEKATCAVTVTPSSNVPKMEIDDSDKNLVVGDAYTIEPIVKIKDQVITDVEFAYSSDNKAVVTVDADGVVTAVKKGSAVVTVSYEYADTVESIEINFNVVYDAVLEISTNDVSLVVVSKNGDNPTFVQVDVNKFEVAKQTVSTDKLVWTSADDGIVTVENGLIKALSFGETTVTVGYYEGDEEIVSSEIFVYVTRETIEISSFANAEIGYDYDAENSGNVVIALPSGSGIDEADIVAVEDSKGNQISDGSLTVSESWFGDGGATEISIYTKDFIYVVGLKLINTKPRNTFSKHNYVDFTLEKKEMDNADKREGTTEFVSTVASSAYYKAISTTGGEIGMYLSVDVYFTEFGGKTLSIGYLKPGWGEASADFKVFDVEGKEVTDLSKDNILNKWLTLVIKINEVTDVSVTYGNVFHFSLAVGSTCVAYLDTYRYLSEEKTFANKGTDAVAEYYLMNDNGEYVFESSEYIGTVEKGSTVEKSAKSIDGYIYESSLSTASAVAGYGRTVLKFYYAKPGTVKWQPASALSMATNEGIQLSYTAKELDGADKREGTYLSSIKQDSPRCYGSRISFVHSGNVANSWLVMNIYIDKYDAPQFAVNGMFGGTNYGSWSDYSAWNDFSVKNFKLFDDEGNEIFDYSSSNITKKWLTLAFKIEKYTSVNSLSFRMNAGKPCDIYIEKYAVTSEEMLSTVFAPKAVVEYYQMQNDKSYALVETANVDGVVFGKEISVSPKSYTGYIYNSSLSVASGKATVGTLKLKLYYDLPNIPWESASVLSAGGINDTGGVTTNSYEAVSGTTYGKDGVYKYTTTFTIPQTAYQARLNYICASTDPVQDLTGYWIVYEMYIESYAGTTFAPHLWQLSGSWGNLAGTEYKVFAEDGTEITNYAKANVTGKWITVAVHQTQVEATTATGVNFGNTAGTSVYYFSQVAKLTDAMFNNLFA